MLRELGCCLSVFLVGWLAFSGCPPKPETQEPSREPHGIEARQEPTVRSEPGPEPRPEFRPEPRPEPGPERTAEPAPKADAGEKPEPARDVSPQDLQPDSRVQPTAVCKGATFSLNQKQRGYMVCVPSPLPPGELPLIMGFHGGGGNANQWRKTTRWEDLAAREGFVFVYMQGCGEQLTNCATPTGSFGWNVQKPGVSKAIDDQAYVLKVLERLKSVHKLSISSSRRFATGHSLGGIFSYSLSCDRPDLFKAIGPISGNPSDGSCTAHGKTSIVHIHGEKDRNVPFERGCCSQAQKTQGSSEYLKGCDGLPLCNNPKNWWPPARSGKHPVAQLTAMDAMAKALGCRTSTQQSLQTAKVLCKSYEGCKKGAGVEFCLVKGVGHGLKDIFAAFDVRSHLWRRFKALQ